MSIALGYYQTLSIQPGERLVLSSRRRSQLLFDLSRPKDFFDECNIFVGVRRFLNLPFHSGTFGRSHYIRYEISD